MAKRPKAEIEACRAYGINLGIAFQLIDDALDYGGTAAKLGKNVGDDFREGKITLPVVLSFRRGSETERAFWNAAGRAERTATATSNRRIGLMKTIARWTTRSSAPAITAPWPAMRSGIFPASAWKTALIDVGRFLHRPRALSVPVAIPAKMKGLHFAGPFIQESATRRRRTEAFDGSTSQASVARVKTSARSWRIASVSGKGSKKRRRSATPPLASRAIPAASSSA